MAFVGNKLPFRPSVTAGRLQPASYVPVRVAGRTVCRAVVSSALDLLRGRPPHPLVNIRPNAAKPASGPRCNPHRRSINPRPPSRLAPAASFSPTPGGLPSMGANMTRNWSCTAKRKATSGSSRTTLVPLPRHRAWQGGRGPRMGGCRTMRHAHQRKPCPRMPMHPTRVWRWGEGREGAGWGDACGGGGCALEL